MHFMLQGTGNYVLNYQYGIVYHYNSEGQFPVIIEQYSNKGWTTKAKIQIVGK